MAVGKTRIDDDETRDVSSVELAAALPFQRSAAVSRVPGPLDVTAHARLAARLVAAPTAAEDDLRALNLLDRDLRARADAAVMEVLATDRAAALAWTAAFERELSRFV